MPVLFILVPFNCKAVTALRMSVVKVAPVPVSDSVKSVFGEASASRIVSTPFVPTVAKVIAGVALERINGVAPDSVSVPEAVISVAPAIAPALDIPPI